MKPIRLCSIFGIPFELRPSFIVLLALVAIHCIIIQSLPVLINLMLLIVIVYGTITLHEFGHCWMAYKVGWKCKAVGLWLLGGVAEISLNPFEPQKELKVALAGPAINALLIWLIWPFSIIFADGTTHLFIVAFVQFNLVLIIFNMIPALPMDGGRVLRSLLTYYTNDIVWSTNVCRKLAYVFALLMVPLTIFNPFMLLIAGFIAISTTYEYQYVKMVDQIFKEAKEKGYECELPSFEELFPPE